MLLVKAKCHSTVGRSRLMVLTNTWAVLARPTVKLQDLRSLPLSTCCVCIYWDWLQLKKPILAVETCRSSVNCGQSRLTSAFTPAIMSDPSSSTLDHRKTAVSFIDNRLPNHHPAFANPLVQFDSMSGRYVPTEQGFVQQPSGVVISSASNALLDDEGIPPRPEWTNICAMNFWNAIFPTAMDQLRSMIEPKGRARTVFDIRNKKDWEMIYDTLEQARNKYQGEGGPVGWLRKVRRKGADNLAPVGVVVKAASKMAPSDPYATPILGAVEMLLDVRQTHTKKHCLVVNLRLTHMKLGCQDRRPSTRTGSRRL